MDKEEMRSFLSEENHKSEAAVMATPDIAGAPAAAAAVAAAAEREREEEERERIAFSGHRTAHTNSDSASDTTDKQSAKCRRFLVMGSMCLCVFIIGMGAGNLMASGSGESISDREIVDSIYDIGYGAPVESKTTPEEKEADSPYTLKKKRAAQMRKLRGGMKVVKKAYRSLEEYYHLDRKLFKNAVIPPSISGDLTVLVDRMKRAMLATSEKDRKFIMAVTGSSVSAGHDNFGEEAWSILLQDILSPIWHALDVNFDLRNQAVGGRNPNPHTLCLGPMVGHDVDVVLREYQYWGFDAGFERRYILTEETERKIWLDKGPRDRVVQAAGLEVFLRTAYRLKSQPAVHFIFLQHSEDEGSRPLSYFEDWFKPGGVFEEYASGDFAINAFDHFGTPFDHLRKRAKKGVRYQKNLNETGGKTVCDEDSEDNVADCPVDFDKQDGHHDDGQLFVNWHPGPLGHKVMAHQLAYYYMGLMQRALDDILIAEEAEDLDELINTLEEESKPKRLPSPKLCNPEVCKNPVKCAYSYLPKASGPDVGDWMINDTNHGWRNILAPNQHVCDLESYYEKGCFTHTTKSKLVNHTECHDCVKTRSYRDQKRAFSGNASAGWVSFQIPRSRRCGVWLCEPPYEWSKPIDVVNWHTDVKIVVNGRACEKFNGCFKVHQFGYKQCGIIQATDIVGKVCKWDGFRLDLRVFPLATLPDSACGLNKESGECEFVDEWDETEGAETICHIQNLNGTATCKANGGRTTDSVSAYISEIIVI